ncbi:MAG TPA: hypothetical protein DDX39_09795 [Bacteroidales bacterium]|nr:MAG: hypothetical protein A2W98_01580 [Bacteroidetes bacterium GWF2_33_38]OFY74012.1 MAG: hypothetical protein A2265_04325 [Bacteroidetes bacterium RIFOXYA12_FULL_33_9]OFY90670.1 MAG: hypothetical protein A2236_04195 [Bacteroidetes bacterium RIFOXYA2_FULL_33_7]HBF88921.1 hypothetical protein [Bacteroidales bacterium]
MISSYKTKFYELVLILSFFFTSFESCKISYSFTGASVSPDVKTISIQDISNQAPLVVPTLSQTFTESLKDKFLSQTNLQLTDSYGDLNVEGEITGYSTQPMAIQGNETAALNRLTISVRIRFTNTKDEKQNFDSSFSRYTDYESSQSLDSVEEELIKEILEQLNEDIFNKALANW